MEIMIIKVIEMEKRFNWFFFLQIGKEKTMEWNQKKMTNFFSNLICSSNQAD